jgi:flagella basal body P-ring formation protein FlgA
MTAVGKAMEDGRVGDCIRVKMQISNTTRIIYVKVNNNGTVEPVM